MKIALCTHKYKPPFVGGVDVYTDRLRRAFLRLGHDPFVIAFDPTGDIEADITVTTDEYDGTLIRRVVFPFDKRPKEAFDYAYDPEMGLIIKGILQEDLPDLLIIINFYTITLAAVEVARELGISVGHVATDFLPICRRGTFTRWDGRSCELGESIKSCAACFVSHHPAGRWGAAMLNRLPDDKLARLAEKRESYHGLHPFRLLRPYWNHVATMARRLDLLRPLRHKIDFIMAPTRYTQQMFIANGFRPEQVHLHPFGVDADNPLAQLDHMPAPQIRFLFIGRLQPYKGAHLLIEAFDRLENPCNATLTIYGAADGHDAYFNRLKSVMEANDRITFAGTIPFTELGDAFTRADFFVLPSTWHENSPLILLDALQSKTAVIASDIGGVTDVVKHGVNGFLFPLGDVDALQQIMQRVIDDPALRDQLQPGAHLPLIDDYAQALLTLSLE